MTVLQQPLDLPNHAGLDVDENGDEVPSVLMLP
jgi:hypothetical protein